MYNNKTVHCLSLNYRSMFPVLVVKQISPHGIQAYHELVNVLQELEHYNDLKCLLVQFICHCHLFILELFICKKNSALRNLNPLSVID